MTDEGRWWARVCAWVTGKWRQERPQQAHAGKRDHPRGKRWRRVAEAAGCALLLSLAVSGCGGGGNQGATAADTVVVAGKNFTEQDIMAQILKQLIEHDTSLHVQLNTWLDSNVVWNAMQSGNIDVYVEYTGTGLVNILKEPPLSNPDAVYQKVKSEFEQKYHITWLDPIGFNNTYAMAMTEEEAQRLGIHTLSDLAKHANQLVLGTEQDFVVREDTLKALERVYNMHFKQVQTMDIGLKYQALSNGKVDVIDAFSTDGRIPQLHLTLLQDDKHVFPPYYACPIVRDSVLQAHPELRGVLEKLAGKINDEQMQKLNMEVDIEHKQASQVAHDWLQQQGLI
ncbi:MAG: glycine/betaine ABC transporter substrate-binding protein [Alicyclobacillus sp.]|nr:glycine/betaine ABC transporter substrate-binding protein [Alicyclobacillus sp.]